MTQTKKKHTPKATTKKMKIDEPRLLVDPKTGEEIWVNGFKYEERDANFHKIWLWHIATALELIGNQKIRILSYILENLDGNNVFIGTQQAIATATDTAIQTVAITIKILVEADIIKMRQPGVYMVHPNTIFKGSNEKRMNILYQYYDIPTKREKET